MKENAASTREDDAPDQWKTVAECAAIIGISERQARRYAGRVAGHDRQEAGHEAGHVATLVRVSAMRDLREKATSRAKRPDTAPDVTPDMKAPEAGHEAGRESGTPDATPDMRPDAGNDATGARVLTVENELLAQLRGENAFLRNAVEQHQRDAAELRAALRKALDAMPKAIESGVQDSPQSPKIAPTTKVSSVAKSSGRRQPRALWRVILGLR